MLMGISAFSQCSLETLKSCSPCLSSRALYSNVDRHDIDPAFLIIKGAKEVTGSLISGHIMFNIALKHLKVWCSFEPDYNYNIAIQTKEIDPPQWGMYNSPPVADKSAHISWYFHSVCMSSGNVHWCMLQWQGCLVWLLCLMMCRRHAVQ